jgi:hypothetical protein
MGGVSTRICASCPHLGFACPPPARRGVQPFLVFGKEVISDRQRVRHGRVMLVP